MTNLVESDFHRGFALLEKYSLVSSMAVHWPEMEKLRNLAAKFPNITIVIDHAGMPMEQSEEYFDNWRRGLSTAAEADKHSHQDLGPRYGRQQLDRGQHQAVRTAMH